MTQHSTSETGGQAVAPTLTSLRVLTGVRGIVSAAHKSRDGVLHGHTWTIIAWFQGQPDAVSKQDELTKYLSIFDHQLLGPEHSWGEALAQAILIGMNCHRVQVSREAEGMYALAELMTPPSNSAGK